MSDTVALDEDGPIAVLVRIIIVILIIIIIRRRIEQIG